MKKEILFGILLLIMSQVVIAQIDEIEKDSLFTSEEISFQTKDGILLKGIVTIPNNFASDNKIAILVSPPQKNDRDYGGMFSSLARTLSLKGIATLRFDNRSYSSPAVSGEDKFTMLDQAEDVYAALQTIKSDKRFSRSQVGLIGHSEGGMSAVIEASCNKQISFVVAMSACGIKGMEFAFQQTIMPYYYLSNIPADRRNKIVANTYRVIQYLGEHDGSLSIEKDFRTFLSKEIPQIDDRETDMMVKYWLTPRQLSYLKFDPSIYFSKIKCRTLILHGMMDGLSNWEVNLNGIERIFLQSGKTNYQIMALEKIDHSYQETEVFVPFFISVQHKPGWKPDYSEEVWNKIAGWIE